MTHCRSVIHEDCSLWVAIICCLLCVFGEITVVPKNTEAVVGSSVTFTCRSTTGNIEWHHLSVGGSSPSSVYNDGFILQNYKERFSVQRSENGVCNLVIANIRPTDAGRYTCLDKSGEIFQRQVELIIFEQYPSNKSCVASFTVTPLDSINMTTLSCEMKSIGNIVPSMEWRETVVGLAIDSITCSSNSDTGITTSSVQFKSTQEYFLLFTCQVKYPQNMDLTSRLSWSYSTLRNNSTQISTTPSIIGGAELSDRSSTYVVTIIAGMCFVMGLLVVRLAILIRHLREKHPIEDDANSRRFVPRTPINKNNAIYGLGILNDEVYLITRDSCILEVFDLESGQFKRSFMVAGLINPNDLAISHSRSFIYISDWKKDTENTEIFCIDKNGKFHHGWNSENEKGRISTTKESNVIVAESWYNTITEYTSAGQLVRKFVAGKQTLHLWLAVKLENGNFLGSFGDKDDEIQKICVFDNDGAMLSSTTRDTLLPAGNPHFVPISLAIGRNGDVYVCDLGNPRIITLTLELKYKDKLNVTEKNEILRGPLRICLCESDTRYQLFVADNVRKSGKWTDGRILVWNLSRMV